MENNVNLQPRWKSKALWVSVLGLLGLILQLSGVFQKIGIEQSEWDAIVTGICSVLVSFGIVNNPTDSAGL